MANIKVTIHSAPWVLPISRPPIREGAVAVFEGRIVGVGPSKDLRLKFPGHVFHYHPNSILLPSFVNAHCHLELSPLKWRLTPTGSLTSWVKELVKARETVGPEEWVPAVKEAVNELVEGGALVVGDVGNTGLIPSIMMDEGELWPLSGIHFIEIIQPEMPSDDDPKFKLIKEEEPLFERPSPMAITVSAHAVHTVHASILTLIKETVKEDGLPFTLHVAESPEEMEFLIKGNGPMLELLLHRGRDISKLSIPNKGPVEFLDELGLLDQKSLLVHCVQLGSNELDIVKERGASICLCPRSNTFLGVGDAPLKKMVDLGINCAIGTDSLASNDKLDLFAEMTALKRIAPAIPSKTILKMATLWGARALGLEGHFGSLEARRSTPFLALEMPHLPQSAEDLEEAIVTSGTRHAFKIEIIR